jgi:hypothetical protein
MREFAQRRCQFARCETSAWRKTVLSPLRNASISGPQARRNTSFVAEFLLASRSDEAALRRKLPA